MAEEAQVTKLKKVLGDILAFREKSLVARPEWGSITFDKADHDFQRIFSLLGYLNILPVEHLTDQELLNV